MKIIRNNFGLSALATELPRVVSLNRIQTHLKYRHDVNAIMPIWDGRTVWEMSESVLIDSVTAK